MDAFNKRFNIPLEQSDVSNLFQKNKEYLSLLQRYSGAPEGQRIYSSDAWNRKLFKTPTEYQNMIVDRTKQVRPNPNIEYHIDTIHPSIDINMGWWNPENGSTYNEIIKSINNDMLKYLTWHNNMFNKYYFINNY
jgi:hypothetical protein